MPYSPAQQALLEHYVKQILAAPVYDIAVRTPLQAAPALSDTLGNNVLLKREDLQPTFSFKIRGAYNKLVQLSDEQSPVASSPHQPVITPKVWRWPRASWALRRRSSCRR